MTWEELLELTTVAICPACDLRHAPVRSCGEAALDFQGGAK